MVWPRLHDDLLAELRSERVRRSRGRVVPRGVKRKMSNYNLRPRARRRTRHSCYTVKIVVRRS